MRMIVCVDPELKTPLSGEVTAQTWRRAASGAMWGLFAALFLVTWWHPIYPVDQALNHSLTVIGVGILIWLQRRGTLPVASVGLLLVFFALHTLAARWI